MLGGRCFLYPLPVIMPNLLTWILFSVRDCLGQARFEELGARTEWFEAFVPGRAIKP